MQEPSSTNTKASLDSLMARIVENPDLNKGILPFLMPTFVKLKQIADFIEGTTPSPDNFQAFYEFKQVCTTDLPNTIEHYCSLPIEMRNTQVLKNKKTARELLIDNLKGIIIKVGEIETSLLSKEAQEFLVNNAYLDKKFSTSNQDLSFSDDFDYKNWSQTSEAQSLYIVKPAPTPQVPTIPLGPTTSEKALAAISNTATNAKVNVSKFLNLIHNNLRDSYAELFGVSVSFTLVGAFLYTVALPFRYGDNQEDIATNLSYAVSALEGHSATKQDLDKVLKRVVDYHENKVGDFFPLLESKVVGDEIVLKYEVDGSQSCNTLALSMANVFSHHNLNASFKIDNVVYQNYALNNPKDFASVAEHISSFGGIMAYKYDNIKKSISDSTPPSDDKNLKAISETRQKRSLETDPAIINLPASFNTAASSFYKNCSLGKVEFEVRFSPNTPIPVYNSAKKMKI